MEELKYLDDIIVFIKNSHNSEATLDEICEKMTGKPYNSYVTVNKTNGQINDSGEFEINKTFYERQNKVVEALRYLYDEKLLRSIDNSFTYRLTFHGIVKSNFGFVDEYLEKEAERKLQNQLIGDQIKEISKSRNRSLWAIVISILTIIASVYIQYQQDNPDDLKSYDQPVKKELPCKKEPSNHKK